MVFLQLVLTKLYSNFVCLDCFKNLQLLSTFRQEIHNKQQKLARFLCQIKDEDNVSNGYSDSSKTLFSTEKHRWNFEPIIIKTEPTDDFPISSPDFYTESSLDSNTEAKSAELVTSQSAFDSIADLPINVKKAKSKAVNPKITRNYEWSLAKTACEHCGKVLKRGSLANHIQLVHMKIKRFFCDHCGVGFFKKQHLIAHLQSHHVAREFRVKDFKCVLCPSAFFSKGLLNKHNKNIHPAEKKLWPCECGKVFQNQYNMNHHQKYTHNKSLYMKTCVECNKTFFNGTLLKYHMKIFHTEGGRGKYLCTECGKRFDTITKLNFHRKLHWDKSLKCDYVGCEKMFATQYLLEYHKKVVHLKTIKRKRRIKKQPKTA